MKKDMTARPKPRVSAERLANVLAYSLSAERQGYPVPISEFNDIVADAIDARAELARMRPVVEAARKWRSRMRGRDFGPLSPAPDLIAEIDTYERGKK